jgi:hypothetical protein
MQMLLTLWCLTVVWGSILLVGVPLTWLSRGRRRLSTSDWVLAPMLGVATIVLVLQGLFYLDIPARTGAPLLWAAIVPLWIWLGRSGQIRRSLRRCPKALFALALTVYMIHGLGLLEIGANTYLGRAWGDQCNYTTEADFLMRDRFSMTPADVGPRPGAFLIVTVLKNDRIGQSILHAFFSVSSGQDPKVLFEPTILLGPALTTLAVHALCCCFSIPRRYALIAGMAAGLLPALALVHLESFLSQALMIPLLLYVPAAIHGLIRCPSWSRTISLAMITAAAASIYTEFVPVLLGLIILMLTTAAVGQSQGWRLLGKGIMLLSGALALNPLIILPIRAVFRRLGVEMLQHVYPWAFRVEGLSRLWFGDLTDRATGRLLVIARSLGLALTGLGCLGIAKTCLAHLYMGPLTWRNKYARASFVLALALLGLVLAPAAILAHDNRHPYQFFKLLLSIAPALVVGLALVTRPDMDFLQPCSARTRPKLVFIAAPLLGLVVIAGGSGTAEMAIQSARLRPISRICAGALLSPDMLQVAKCLQATRKRNLLLACTDGIHDFGIMNEWFAYFARHNRVWSTDSWLSFSDFGSNDSAAWLVRSVPRPLPRRLLMLTQDCFSRVGSESGGVGDVKISWRCAGYSMWEGGDRPWAVPLRLRNPNGVERDSAGSQIAWMGKDPTTLEILVTHVGSVNLLLKILPGPSLAQDFSKEIDVETDEGYRTRVAVNGAELSVRIPVKVGINVIRLGPRDKGLPGPLPNGDARCLLWRLTLQSLCYSPHDSAQLGSAARCCGGSAGP